MTPTERLKNSRTVLVFDWPTKEVPETLARAGLRVMVRGGPGPEDYSLYELRDGGVQTSRLGRAPESADLIYAYRPIAELPSIIETAKRMNAKEIWTQSGMSGEGVRDPKGCWVSEQEEQFARNLVRSAGLSYRAQPYIGDVALDLEKKLG
jgi:predicted CoA-binding protein